jgi:antirestriction protein ArdC
MEELVAESGSMMIAGIAGLNPNDGGDNSLAYIQGWCKKIKETPSKAIVSALTQSSKAVDMIVGEVA